MGYSTDFRGSFKLDKPLDEKTKDLLDKLANTRRLARDVGPEFGVDGEFCMDETAPLKYDHNTPPKTQPGLWCQWVYDEEENEIRWDGNEKFYNYVAWIIYIVMSILEPRDYVLNGKVEWRGEEWDDRGTITINNNQVKTYE